MRTDRCLICKGAMPPKKPRGRRAYYCGRECAKMGEAKAREHRRVLGVKPKGKPLPPKPRESAASFRYREAVVELATAKDRAEAARRGVEIADGSVEQAEIRLKDAETVLNRERRGDEDIPARPRRLRSRSA